MNIYLDTSVLVKYFYEESGTDQITTLIEESTNQIYISEIAKLEFSCSLFRKFRNKEIAQSNLEKALSSFAESLSRFNVEPLSQIILNEAFSLISLQANKFPIRTLDSIHVATFKIISDPEWSFATSDKELINFVKSFNQNVITI